MAALLSTGVIIFLCSIVLTTIVLIILYCVCRSSDPLYDHTCVAWFHPPRTAKQGQHTYNVLPLYETQNGHKEPRDDRPNTIEKPRMNDNKEKPKSNGVDVMRNEYHRRYPEKCPLSIDEPDFYRSGGSNEKGGQSSRRQSHETENRSSKDREHHSKTKEFWEPKAKGNQDIYRNKQNYSRSRSVEHNIDGSVKRGYPSRSLDLIDKYDERDGALASSLYLRPRSLERKDRSDHYMRPRSMERGESKEKNRRDSHHSYSHYVRPRSLERDERKEKDSHHSSSHYVRPRSMERDERTEKDRRDSHHSSSHYVCPRSLERDERKENDIRESRHSSSRNVRGPRSMERDEKSERDRKRESHQSSSHYVRPRSHEWDNRTEKDRDRSSSHNVSESLYVHPRSISQEEPNRNEKNKQTPHEHSTKQSRPRSTGNIHSKDMYYQNITINDEQFSKTPKEDTPLLQSSEEITMSEVQALSAEVIPEREMEHQLDKDEQRRFIPEDRDKAKAARKRDVERDDAKEISGSRDGKERDGTRKRDGEKRVETLGTQKRDGSEPPSRPRSRSIEYRITRSPDELNGDRRFNHSQREKESYFLPRTQSVSSAQPQKNVSSPIARRHTIHLEFHPRSGDVTPLDSEKEIDLHETRLKATQGSRPKERRESSSKTDIKTHNIAGEQETRHYPHEDRRNTVPSKKQNIHSTNEHRGDNQKQGLERRNDATRRSSDDNKRYSSRYDSLADGYMVADQKPRPEAEKRNDEHRRSSDDNRRYSVPSRYDSLADGYMVADQKPRPEAEKSNDEPRRLSDDNRRYTIPPRFDSLADGYRGTDQKPRPVTEEPRRSSTGHWQDKEPPKNIDLSDGYSSTNQKPLPVSKDIRDGPIRSSTEHRLDKGPTEYVDLNDNGITDQKRLPVTENKADKPRGTSVEDQRDKGPTQYLDLDNDHGITDQKRLPVTENKADKPRGSSVEDQRDKGPSRTMDLADGNRKTDQNTKLVTEERGHYNKSRVRELTFENVARSRKSIDSTSSGTTMESIISEIRSSSIYETTDDDMLVLREPSKEDRGESVEHSQETQKKRKPPKRNKSMERLFYVKSVRRYEPALDVEEPPKISNEKNIDWMTGEKVDLTKDAKLSTQDRRPAGDDVAIESAEPTQGETLPTKVSSEKKIDWHLFTMTGEKLDLTKDTKISKQDSAQPTKGEISSMTSTKESIRHSLGAQIKYGEELHTPSVNSLTRIPKDKPVILNFE